MRWQWDVYWLMVFVSVTCPDVLVVTAYMADMAALLFLVVWCECSSIDLL